MYVPVFGEMGNGHGWVQLGWTVCNVEEEWGQDRVDMRL